MDHAQLLVFDHLLPREAGPACAADTLEQVATLVECAASSRWSRFAEVALDLTGAMTVDVDDAGEGAPARSALGRATASLRPRADVRVTLTFSGEEARAAAAPALRAIARILGAAGAPPRVPGVTASPRPVADAIAALPLSPRMREVARLVVAGRSDKEIADELGVSYASARSYVQRMCKNLGVSGRGGVLRTVLGDAAGARRRRLPSPVRAGRGARE